LGLRKRSVVERGGCGGGGGGVDSLFWHFLKIEVLRGLRFGKRDNWMEEVWLLGEVRVK
jgi:hypothetical protein